MPFYYYQALDSKGKKRSGHIEAQGEREAKSRLRNQGVMVTQLSIKTTTSSKQNFNKENLLTFTLQLSQLVGAGVPLYESLNAIEEQCRTDSFHPVITSLCEQIKAGTPLSGAMSYYPQSFNKMYCAMIAAGEASGSLDLVLEKLTQLLAKQIKLKKQIVTAMIYPAILGGFCLLIIAMLLGFVVPSIEGIFEGRELNRFTKTILSVSHVFRDFWWLYLPVIILTFTWSIIKLRSSSGKLWLEKNVLKIPLIKTLVIQASVTRFCRTMGTLLQGGLTIIDSMRIAQAVMHNVVLEEEVKKAENKIIEGSSLSLQLSRSKWFPQMVSRMLAVGEESGTTIPILNKIADMYEDELEKTLERVMALAQPVILIVMGTLIGVVLLAILLPMTDISSFTSER